MNIRIVLKILGGLLICLAVAMLMPIPFAIYYNDPGLWPCLYSAGISFIVGVLLILIFSSKANAIDLSVKEGFATVTLGWIFVSIVGALPYIFSGTIPSWTDAIFESMSGFTTTGSTIITQLAVIPKSILFWRSESQWLGGMGIIVLSVAILPFLGVGGMQIFQAEVPGHTTDKLGPKIQNTAKLLWGIYFLLTALELVMLMFGGLSFFDSICHAFTTMATGGFSTYDASIAHFKSSYVHWVITFFMFMAGINFTLHYHAITGKPLRYLLNEEFRVYFAIFFVATAIFTIINSVTYSDISINIRDAAFQVVSMGTSTGYATADYERWPVLTQFIIIILMVVGSSSGSTGGGVKVARVMLAIKHSVTQIFQLIHPKSVLSIKQGNKAINQDTIMRILGFLAIYALIFFIASMIMAALGMDMVSATSAVIACMSNIGPGLESVGPTDNFAHIPVVGKVVLTICMLVGRLEFFTVLVLLFPSFWRR